MTNAAMDWHLLRPLEGSQQNAFEELCAQLAGAEKMPEGSLFVRRGSPDAGIECYWQLANGDLHAWQAKFFLDIPKETQWKQIDESVNTALEKHSRLVCYTICLPIDRSDARHPKKKSFMDRWTHRVNKWKRLAGAKGLNTDFKYWGQSEIIQRLFREEHRGQYYFWFNKELFSQAWFEQKLKVAIANAGKRYIPALNVDVQVRGCFRGLGRVPEFYDDFDRLRGEIRRAARDALSSDVESAFPEAAFGLRASVDALLSGLGALDRASRRELPLGRLRSEAGTAATQAAALASSIRELERAEQGKRGSQASMRSLVSGGAHHYVYKLGHALGQLDDLTRSDSALLANTPALLLEGDAGVGKTHLFCDVAQTRLSANQGTILMLGEQFSRDEPWSQIIRMLGLACSTEELLGALNAAGESRRCRTLVMIDALNEGDGIRLWKKYLAGLLQQVRDYPWVGIALSVRAPYEDVIVPDGLVPDRLVRVYHRGFVGLESVAVARFFAHYGIASPGIPLMQPEFSNPPFLRLFCEAISNRGWTHVPSGLDNLTGLFAFFLNSVNQKLAGAEYLDFDERDQVVQRAVRTIARSMAEADQRWLPRERVRDQLNLLYPSEGYERSLFRHLLSEGVFSQDRFWAADGTVEGVRFTYERFSDHQIATYYLDEFLDAANPAASFAPDQPLGRKLTDERSLWSNAGLVHALAIQLPERIGRELPELAPQCQSARVVREAVIESIMWREHNAFSAATLRYFNDALRFSDTARFARRAMLSISTLPGHPYNADFLYRNLMRRPMPERDAWWSTFLHYEWYEDQGPVRRILDWAMLRDVQGSITDESRLLMGTVLAWFLTASNRFLRDRATKALGMLLDSRIAVLCQLLERFRAVDDLYVLERLLAVAYGCSMRSSDTEALKSLAAWCYESIFRGSPPVHLLARDYARGVIERALHLGADLALDRRKIEPPYGSRWPRRIPSEAALKPLGAWEPEGPSVHPSQHSIYRSVMVWDFARYIIGTNSGSFDWIDLRLGKPLPPSAHQLREQLEQSLSESQRELWHLSERANSEHAASRFRLKSVDGGIQIKRVSNPVLRKLAEAAAARFAKSLSSDQLRLYRSYVAKRKHSGRPDAYRFDLTLIQRFVLNRVFELGWTAERFGDFDRDFNSHQPSRDSHKPERIGKKYQWLAYHEALARVADNFVFKEWWSGRPKPYLGPWQTWQRDIDPSNLVLSTERTRSGSAPQTWWAPTTRTDWRRISDDMHWLKNRGDLPEIQQALQATDPVDGSHWAALDAYYHWEEATPLDRERFEIPSRMIWCQLRSYIVRKEDFAEVFDWAMQQNYMGRWMPESHETHRLFLGELFWSPAYRDVYASDLGQGAWTRGDRSNGQRIPKPVVVTALEYSWEAGGYDCSLEDSIGIYVPSPWLAAELQVQQAGREGECCDRRGRVIFRDPSVYTPGPPALLVRESTLRAFLRRAGYEIFWTVLGEKEVITPGSHFPARTEFSGAMAIQGQYVTGRITRRFRNL